VDPSLEDILKDKRAEVSRLDERLLRNVRPSTRDLRLSLGSGRQRLSLFAEFKRWDAGGEKITGAPDLPTWTETLQQLGVGALVVNTDSRTWGGSRDDLIALERQGVQIPLIRNDFIIDRLQLYESRAAGADALFLRPSLLDDESLESSLRVLHAMHMTGIPLVETPAELDRVLALEAPVLAVSRGEPTRREAGVEGLLQMAAKIPGSRSVIACFDIEDMAHIRQLQGHVDALCLGTGLLRSSDPATFLMQLIAP
jgi:indole-3-glycerol phosphate synthase